MWRALALLGCLIAVPAGGQEMAANMTGYMPPISALPFLPPRTVLGGLIFQPLDGEPGNNPSTRWIGMGLPGDPADPTIPLQLYQSLHPAMMKGFYELFGGRWDWTGWGLAHDDINFYPIDIHQGCGCDTVQNYNKMRALGSLVSARQATPTAANVAATGTPLKMLAGVGPTWTSGQAIEDASRDRVPGSPTPTPLVQTDVTPPPTPTVDKAGYNPGGSDQPYDGFRIDGLDFAATIANVDWLSLGGQWNPFAYSGHNCPTWTPGGRPIEWAPNSQVLIDGSSGSPAVTMDKILSLSQLYPPKPYEFNIKTPPTPIAGPNNDGSNCPASGATPTWSQATRHISRFGVFFPWFAGATVSANQTKAGQILGLPGAATSAQMRRGSFYGDMIDCERSWSNGSNSGSCHAWSPAFGTDTLNASTALIGMVESGTGDITGNSNLITPAEMNWAAWSSIIHGARVLEWDSGIPSATVAGGQTISPYDQAADTGAMIWKMAVILNMPFTAALKNHQSYVQSTSPALGYDWPNYSSNWLNDGIEVSTRCFSCQQATGSAVYFPFGFYIFAATRYSETSPTVSFPLNVTFTIADKNAKSITSYLGVSGSTTPWSAGAVGANVSVTMNHANPGWATAGATVTLRTYDSSTDKNATEKVLGTMQSWGGNTLVITPLSGQAVPAGAFDPTFTGCPPTGGGGLRPCVMDIVFAKTLTTSNGVFSDTFAAPSTVHIYHPND
jgi:hypothetical protein